MRCEGQPGSVLRHCGLFVLLLFLFGYILFPALKTLETSLTANGAFSFIHYKEFFTNETSRLPLLNSVTLGLLSVIACGSMGTSLAFAINFYEFPGRSVADKLLLLPLVMPGIIIVFAFVQLYGESGMVTKLLQLLLGMESPPFTLSGLTGILVIHAYTQYIYFYITVSIAIKQMDYSAIESASNLGASQTRVFFSIILPFLKPAIIAAAAMTFISGAGSFTAPSIIGGNFKVLTTQILLSKANNYMGIAATQVSILTSISILFFIVFRIYEAKSQFTSSVKGVLFRPVAIRNSLYRILIRSIVWIIIGSILLPMMTIVLVSFVPSSSWMVDYFPRVFTLDNYSAIFTSARKLQPFFNSSVMAIVAAGVGLIVAIPSSFVIVKTKLKAKWVVEFLTMLPWAIPPSAIAINIINAFNEPTIFSLNEVLVGTSILLPLGYLIRSLPIMVKTLNVSFQNLNEVYVEASKSLGGSNFDTFKNVAVPILFPGIWAGFLLIFIRSIGEYTVSVFLYNATNKPLSIAMVNGVFEYNLGLAMAYGTLLIVLTFLLSLIMSRFLGMSS
ncbi:iron ABC transporter permease [Desulfopila sp. IMCC35008]|uniref:ABC transporter permease n=1 Tax=Desulfopila sp. IMCC35008 TaxID=2653858 RepID=UPI0013CFEFDF|nr:iron ABC transporter permease [Desulfopila sp. IMCC35008]